MVLAWDRLLDREVAIKEVSAAGTPAAVARFLAEARLTARLEHPSIIPVHDAGEDENGSIFYVMKRVEGESLEQALASCATLPERLTHLDRLIAVVHAVAHAHARGVLHRDLKPANIMVGPRGETLLLDWGIAVHLSHPDNGFAGTPGFMSPEACRGEALDVRSDVWALGAILHQLLSGHPPAEGDDPWAVVRRVAKGPVPPVRRLAPQSPPPLAAIADRALAFDREDRYATADALVADLQAWRTGLAVSAYHYAPGEAVLLLARRYRLPLAALGVGLVVAAFVAVTGFLRVRAERDVAETALASALEQQAAVADRDGDGLGALAYAAAALSRGERPLARGFVVRHHGTFPYRLAERLPLEGCVRITGHACIRGDEVVDRAGRWHLPLPGPVVAAHEGAGRLILGLAGEVWSLDVVTGAAVARYPAARVVDVWQHPTDPDRLAWSGERHLVLVERGARFERDYASLLKAVAWRDGKVQMATASGEVWEDAAGPGMTCQEHRGLVNAEFTPDGSQLVAVTYSGALEVIDVATCASTLGGGSDVPAGGQVRWAQGGSAFVGRVADGTVRAWNRLGEEVLRLPRIPGWDTAVRPTDDGFEVATPREVLRYEAAPARLGKLPGPPAVNAVALGPDGTWIVGGTTTISRWGWDRELWWTRPVGSVRGLAWADDRVWALAGDSVFPFTADGAAEPAVHAPLVRGILANWGATAVLLSGSREQDILTRAAVTSVPGAGTDGSMARGADGWLIRGENDGWSRIRSGGEVVPVEAPANATYVSVSPDGLHRGWLDADGATWIDGMQTAPSGERRLWIEWVASGRWLVTSRLGSSVLDDRGPRVGSARARARPRGGCRAVRQPRVGVWLGPACRGLGPGASCRVGGGAARRDRAGARRSP